MTMTPVLCIAVLIVTCVAAHRFEFISPNAASAHNNALCPQHIGWPCPRNFENTMSDYKPGDSVEIPPEMAATMRNLTVQYTNSILENRPPSFNDSAAYPWTVYGGHAGRALMFLRLWKLEKVAAQQHILLNWAKQYIDAAELYLDMAPADLAGFIEGPEGVYCVKAVVYHLLNQPTVRDQAIALVQKSFDNYQHYTKDFAAEGLAGLLYCQQFLNRFFNKTIISTTSANAVVQKLVADGQKIGQREGILKYLSGVMDGVPIYLIGAAEGTAGVLHELLEQPSAVQDPSSRALLEATVNSIVAQQLPDGNFPFPGNSDLLHEDVLVQWCEGAGSQVEVLLKAHALFGNQSHLDAAYRAADTIWKRGLLTKGLCQCHGIGGNAYQFLAMYRYTNDPKFLFRALQFTRYSLDLENVAKMRVPDWPWCMYAGSYAGAVLLYSDLLNGAAQSSMLAYDFDI
eukprot:TRINITY_DN13870_c0_g1_i1.p1 TRINITY_DN13870_c0_g1~~TRINITY_DN13870_c0_g1_i1.p1  ORF type:complete len:466 (+),score=115.96 TRINITY_DN13870_c0_g1_i1:28-1398(+)